MRVLTRVLPIAFAISMVVGPLGSPGGAATCTRTLTTASFAGLTIPAGQVWCLNPAASTTITSTANVVVQGTLVMRPSVANVVHTLRFINIQETRFVGGGDNPLGTDVGLWVTGAGALDLAGATKTPLARLTGTIAAGASQIVLDATPVGWAIGDELSFGPTLPGEARNAFEVRTIISISDRTIRLSSPLSRRHAAFTLPNGVVRRPEVLNLTRNVRIEGTPTGRTHMFLRPTVPQSIRNVAIRYAGVPVGGNPESGRYAMHFHRAGNATRNSIVEGVVARDVGNHAFVAHNSHGITFRGTIAYNFARAAYWWDRNDAQGVVQLTHDTRYEDCVAANGGDMGVLHNFGTGNSTIRCLVYGIEDENRARGFGWPAEPTNQMTSDGVVFNPNRHTVWRWEDGVAHNIGLGTRANGEAIWIWQIDVAPHILLRPIAYNTAVANLHGAYVNVYEYRDGVFVSDGSRAALELHAAGGTTRTAPPLRQRHAGTIYDAGGASHAISIVMHSAPGAAPGLFLSDTIRGFTRNAVRVHENSGDTFSRGGSYDFVDCRVNGTAMRPTHFEMSDVHPSSVYRIQDSTSRLAWRFTRATGWVPIMPFF